MPFTTLSFICFFSILFFAYYIVSEKKQWVLLLVGSMFFYGYASPSYLFLLWATILVTYMGTLAIGRQYKCRDRYLALHKGELSREDKRDLKKAAEKRARRWLFGTIAILMLLLGVFKYAQFAIDNVLAFFRLVGMGFNGGFVVDLILPIGLSFYLFQSVGYCMDVFREEVSPETNVFKHALFVSYFPQILQGPIGNYGRLAPQLLCGHRFEYDQVVFGLQRVAWGFFKKLVVANRIADYVNPVWSNADSYAGLGTWLFFCGLYAVQLYADFSGYMDVACGCSRMLGIGIDENFNCPYFSRSVSDYWRHWHITLSEWFKNYLFYPILRSEWNLKLRRALANKYLANVIPTSLALVVVWFVTGLWHGASWGYVAWGVYYGFFMITAVVMTPLYDGLHRHYPRFFTCVPYGVFQMVRTFVIVVIGYSIFKPADLSATCEIWKSATSFGWADFLKVWYSHPSGWIMCLGWTALLATVDIVHLKTGNGYLRGSMRRLPLVVRYGIYLLGVWAILFFGLYGEGLNQFEYFKF